MAEILTYHFCILFWTFFGWKLQKQSGNPEHRVSASDVQLHVSVFQFGKEIKYSLCSEKPNSFFIQPRSRLRHAESLWLHLRPHIYDKHLFHACWRRGWGLKRRVIAPHSEERRNETLVQGESKTPTSRGRLDWIMVYLPVVKFRTATY